MPICFSTALPQACRWGGHGKMMKLEIENLLLLFGVFALALLAHGG